ncbi:MFS transporter [Rhodococcus sp. OK302]|uniref:MFS transporter n=1 Tax=Rhodococcus sp. OK302 TaxID=1882769 RepID=UPI0020CB94CB|nr:MFS transporter [Rhodococcus sp. OK302]
MLVAALTGLVLGLSKGNDWGWISISTVASLGGGVILLVIWAVWERRIDSPIIDLKVILRREVWPAFIVCALTSFVGLSAVLTASQYLQTPEKVGYGFGMTPLMVGLYFLPLGMMMAFGGMIMRPIIGRFGVRAVSALGGLVTMLTFGWFSMTDEASWKFLVMLFFLGTAYALTVTAGASAYLRASRPGETGMVSGAARIVASALGAIGPAIVTALLTASFIPKTKVPEGNNYDNAWMFFALCGAIVMVISFLIRQSAVRNDLAPNTVQEV